MLDKIIVFGDSISYGKWDEEGGWVARVRKYIDQKYNLVDRTNLLIYNLGIPGEVATRMVKRVEPELSSRLVDPDDKVLVLFAIGINDSCPNNWLTGKQTPEKEFKKALKDMAICALDKNCQVAFVGLTPINPNKITGRGLLFTNEVVKLYDLYISEVAKEVKVSKLAVFADLEKTDYQKSMIDIVHPDLKGHEMLAQKVLDFLAKNFGV